MFRFALFLFVALVIAWSVFPIPQLPEWLATFL